MRTKVMVLTEVVGILRSYSEYHIPSITSTRTSRRSTSGRWVGSPRKKRLRMHTPHR
jgi:hypothetical protein